MRNGLLTCLLLSFFAASAQDAVKPRPSPLAVVSSRYKDTYIKVTYSQPHKHGRQIFGGLVPYGQVWRTGANEATELTVTRDVKINGKDLRAGTYSMFTIPGKESWTVILNAELGLWGAYNYNSKLDVLRFEVPVIPVSEFVYEAFTILIDPRNSRADLILAWDKTKISIPIQFQEPTQ
ncbi:MAG: DUF2911 domain-containing protein [Cyclobacteriaceae bacterium]|nr:DUF2911 domain-containing protein [Cyclobacteriaceae bacterium]